jgi:hypothetical protein
LTLFALLAALLLTPALVRAAVTASLDRDTVYTGDTVTLRITTTGNQQGEQPDLTPLQKDFEVLGTSSSRRIQIINGQRSDKDEWQIELAPRNSGTLSIPPIKVRDSHTAELTLQVKELPEASSARAGQPVFITTEVSSPEADTYVQQQILYTVRLHYRVPLIEGSLGDPRVDNAVIEHLGKDKQYKTTINGQQYEVVERHYAIFPERSGELHIGPSTFSGRAASPSDQRSSFSSMDSLVERMLGQRGFGSSMGSGKRLRVRSDLLTLDIKPRPDAFEGSHWLPSQQLNLRDSWAEAPPALRAGEPVTRILTVEAKGLEASQLPEIILPESGALRIYPEQPELSNRTDGDWIYGRSEQRFTYVATQPGKLSLPEVRIDWWDSMNNEPRVTVLPAWELSVEAGTNTPMANNPANEAVNKAPDSAQEPDSPEVKAGIEQNTQNLLLYWISGAALLAAIATLLMMARRKRLIAPGGPGVTGSINTLTHTRSALQKACAMDDAQAASSALLDRAAAIWPDRPPRSLGALAGLVDRRAAETVRELESALYSATGNRWSGQALWEVFSQGLKIRRKTAAGKRVKNPVPPLYPDWKGKTG